MGDLFRRLFGSAQGVHLDPPGADDLSGKCIRCARCVEACPYQSIELAPLAAGRRYGKPWIDPARSPCFLCMKCPEVCPTGALSPLKKEEVRLGKAKVVEDTCYSWNGTICNLCYKRCPLKNTAIVLDDLFQPVVQADTCTGCGVCFHVCPTEPARSIELTSSP